MKKTCLILILAATLGAGCKKDPVPPAPKADFTMDSQTVSAMTVQQGTHLPLVSNSENSVSYLWDFGDGTTSTDKELIHVFEKAGTFNVSLTVKSPGGQTSTAKKQVKVLTAVANLISIKDLGGLAFGLDSDVPKISKADVWIEIRKSDKGFLFTETPDGTDGVSLIYKSPVVQNVTPASTPVINVGNLPLDVSAIYDRRCLITLYAKDQTTGKTYRLFNNSYSGSDNTYNGSIKSNSFLWAPSFAGGYRIEITGIFQ
jgi:PKD repeat protein